MSEDNILKAVKSQYRASCEMLAQAINKCPDTLWLADNFRNKFWHIAYHAIFYTHLYLQPSDTEFKPWHKHRPNYQFLGAMPWSPFERPVINVPYSREEVLEYYECCMKEIRERVHGLDINAPSGFPWLQFTRMELYFYNIRHIQHHAAQLIDRLRNTSDIEVAWVGRL